MESRLFTGLSLPPEVLANFEELLNELEPLARIQWSALHDLHITTKFIGPWPFSKVSELGRFMHNFPRVPKFSLKLTGLSYLPGRNRSRVLYAKVEPCETMTTLAAMLNDHLAALKVPLETVEYLPHVTIGRIPGQNPWPELSERVQAYAEKPFGEFDVHEYHLYESTPARYRQFVSIPLG